MKLRHHLALQARRSDKNVCIQELNEHINEVMFEQAERKKFYAHEVVDDLSDLEFYQDDSHDDYDDDPCDNELYFSPQHEAYY